jgi:hypothetical protein
VAVDTLEDVVFVLDVVVVELVVVVVLDAVVVDVLEVVVTAGAVYWKVASPVAP